MMQQQIGTGLELPVQVQQLAEAQHMGALVAIYPHVVKTHAVTVAIVSTLFIGITLIGLIAILPWSYYLGGLLVLGLVIYILQVRAQVRHRQDQIVLYDAGFISFNGGTALAYRWESIDYLLRGVTRSPTSGELVMDLDRLTVHAGTQTFTLPNDLPANVRAYICDRIERAFVTAHLPRAIAQYREGGEILFGTSPNDLNALWVSQAGFRTSTELLPWPALEKVEVDSTRVVIRKEGRTSDWYEKRIDRVPNAALLKALLEYRQSYL